jgi:hypothetical protein
VTDDALWAEFDRLRAAIDARPDRREMHGLWCQLREVQRSIAAAFGARRGWRLAERGFDADALARRAVSGPGVNPHGAGSVMSPWDHPYHYRETVRPYRAAAVAAHPYGLDFGEARRDLAAWADGAGLLATVSAERSWWNPDRCDGHSGTRLVVYTPEAAAPIAAADWRATKMVRHYLGELADRPAWVAWRRELRGGAWREIPLRARGDITDADPGDPDHLGTLNEARTRAAAVGGGIALVLDRLDGVHWALHLLGVAARVNYFEEGIRILEEVRSGDGRTEWRLIPPPRLSR